MADYVVINSKDIKVRTYNGNRVINPRDIDMILGNEVGYSSNLVRQGIQRKKDNPLIQNKDYISVPKELFNEYKNDDDVYNYPRGGTLITASGFMKAFGKRADAEILNKYFGIKVAKKPESVKEEKVEEKKQSDIQPATSVDATLIREMIDNCNKVMDLQMQFLQKEREANAELREIIKNMVNAIIAVGNNEKRLTDIESYIAEFTNEDFREWKKKIDEAANKVMQNNSKYKSTNEVLSKAYSELTKDYGVVFDQEKKEFYAAEGRGPANTRELMYWIKKNKSQYRNLLIGRLNKLYSER